MSQGLDIGTGQEDPATISGYHTTLVIGHLVIDVYGAESSAVRVLDPDYPEGAGLVAEDG